MLFCDFVFLLSLTLNLPSPCMTMGLSGSNIQLVWGPNRLYTAIVRVVLSAIHIQQKA